MTTLSQNAMEVRDKVVWMKNDAFIFTLRTMMSMMLPYSSHSELLFYINVLKSVDAKETTRYSLKEGINNRGKYVTLHRLDNLYLRGRTCTIAYENGDFIVSTGDNHDQSS